MRLKNGSVLQRKKTKNSKLKVTFQTGQRKWMKTPSSGAYFHCVTNQLWFTWTWTEVTSRSGFYYGIGTQLESERRWNFQVRECKTPLLKKQSNGLILRPWKDLIKMMEQDFKSEVKKILTLASHFPRYN